MVDNIRNKINEDVKNLISIEVNQFAKDINKKLQKSCRILDRCKEKHSQWLEGNKVIAFAEQSKRSRRRLSHSDALLRNLLK